MPDIYVIGDTIRFTAEIKDMEGNLYDPQTIAVSVIGADGAEFLEETTPTKTDVGNYYYDWQIQGMTENYNLMVVWEWDNNMYRMKFKVVPETDY